MADKNMRRALGVLAVVGGFIAVQACTSSSETTGTPTASDAAAPDADTTTDDASTPVPDATASDASETTCPAFTGNAPANAGEQCHDLANTGAFVAAVEDPGTMPVGTGGTITDGLYHLTELRTWPGSPLAGFTVKITVVIKDGVSYQVTDIDGNPKSLRKIEAENPDGGNGIPTCSTTGPESLKTTSYTASCNEIYTYDATAKFMTKLTKQP